MTMTQRNESLPTVAVIMPAYRSSTTLRRAAQSVLRQTYTNIALVIAIRPSDSETMKTATALGDPRVRIVMADGAGISNARNCAVQSEPADLYMFMDSDDAYAAEDVLERYIGGYTVDRSPALWYGDWTAISPVSGHRTSRRMPAPKRDQYTQLLLENFVATGTVMVSAAVFESCGLFDEHYEYAEDWDLWLRVARRFPLRHIPVNAYLYTRTKLARLYPRILLLTELNIIHRQPASRPVKLLAAAISRGRYAAYYLRTICRRRGRELLDVRLLDLLALPVAVALRFIRYRRVLP